MEYAKGGELFNYIVNKKRLDDKESSFFFTQIINGLEYVHKNNIVHR
jgi:serine/threonine protein kinase